MIFMPHIRTPHTIYLNIGGRPAARQNGNNAPVHMSACKFASSILCRFTFSLFLFAIALFLFQLSFNNASNKKEGSNIIAAILLTIAIVSFLRTCQTLRRYLTIMHTRRRLIQVRSPVPGFDLTRPTSPFSFARDYVNDNKLTT